MLFVLAPPSHSLHMELQVLTWSIGLMLSGFGVIGLPIVTGLVWEAYLVKAYVKVVNIGCVVMVLSAALIFYIYQCLKAMGSM